MRNVAATVLTALIALIFFLIGRLPSSVTPWTALAGVLVLWLVIRVTIAMLGGTDDE
jgi:hypothetical protein